MIGVQELRKGATFEMDGQLYRVLEATHNKQGRGNATIRTRLRNLRTGATVEYNFLSGGRVNDVRLDRRNFQYLYHDGDLYYFMDMETYEQAALTSETLSDTVPWLTDGMEVQMEMYGTEPINIELPTTVDLEVVETAPGFKGDTATGGGKPATLATGITVQVPFFVDVGDTIRVDTRTGEYVTRV
jgi:elongation factor P